MKKLIINRYHKSANGVCGQLFDDNDLICFTLERPDLNNQSDNQKTSENDSSCIPCGIYKVKMVWSNRFGDMKFRLLNVPGRDGILIHSANHIGQLLGCIAVGNEIIKNYEFNGKIYPLWLRFSNKTLKKLEEKYSEGFELEIKELITNAQKEIQAY